MKTITVSAVGLMALVVGACASSGDHAAAIDSPRSQGEGATAYPLVIENCGVPVTYPAPPQRAVTLNQTAAEILIRLGVEDRIVGTGYEIEKINDDIAPQYDAIPQLSAHGQEIKHEALLSAQPDFVYSSFASFLTAEQSGTREELHRLGVSTYLTEFDCTFHQAVAGAGFDLLFDEYRQLASIFDVAGRGEQMVTEQQAVIDSGLDAAQQIDGTPTVMWFYSTYGGTPYAAGPGGLPQHVSELIGVANIFDDASTKWPEVSWDEVAARNPDIIVLADLTRGEPGDTAQEKVELLRSDALTSQLPAVKNNRFVVIPGSYMDPGYSSAYAVPALAEGIVGLQ
ncbi:Vitamin B12-binding protein [Mycolicibacterium vanbaalenii]|uniref:Vitamin B12-binding protein n=2 Tax=Mycolicibacterium vanbaalenii TaxID=110539 RepID=A0A5S9MX55_MYCVN|nr:Vitamin B12-binding protein [Mycolicibacterium vanbaalenii]